MRIFHLFRLLVRSGDDFADRLTVIDFVVFKRPDVIVALKAQRPLCPEGVGDGEPYPRSFLPFAAHLLFVGSQSVPYQDSAPTRASEVPIESSSMSVQSLTFKPGSTSVL